MDSPKFFWLGLLSILAITLAFGYYIRLALRLKREGGEVRPGPLGFPDLFVSVVLSTFLAALALLAFRQTTQGEMAITREVMLVNAGFQLALVACLLVFLKARGVRILDVVRRTRISAPRAIWRAALMLICALPVVGVFSAISYLLPQDLRSEQEMVKLFGDVSTAGNLEMIVLVAITAVVVAPLCEEFIFRGYFYPVWKQYFGPVGSAVLAATLFALMHANLASLPGLFALAICFILAFEATGSLAVPMLMHALFNGLSLTMLYLRAKGIITG
ncbi:MAG: CPBP family intramembrane metalloprotease [Verrucomicrobiaceae bacterium]|nr:MAG: CPBP family intramembrane metalloprotease [Verrucomicrobiaceae bacterium]